MTLRARLAMILTVTVLLPLLAVGSVVAVLVPYTAEQAAAERLQVSARSAASALSARCTALGLAARSLALEAAPALAAGQPPPQEAAETAIGAIETGSAAVLGPGGAVLAGAGPTDLAGTEGLSCSEGSSAAPPGLQVESVPIRSAGGDPVGWAVAGAAVDDQTLDALRQRAALPAPLLLVGDGQVVASGVGTTGLGQAELQEVAEVAQQEGEPFGEVGDLRYATSALPPNVPGVLVAVAPHPAPWLQWAVPLLVGLAALLAVAGTVATARRLTAPLAELAGTVDRLREGDLDARTGVEGRDEVGRLGSAVNALADALQGSLAETAARREAAADALERFGEALARTHDLDGLLQTVAESVAAEAGADTCAVFLGEGPRLVQRAVVDQEVHSRDTAVRLHQAARRAVDERREVVDRDTPGITVAALPLTRADDVLGAVVLAGRQSLSGPPLAAARSLVGPAGTAVSNVLVHTEAARLSLTDPLTGLANFRSLAQALAREVERANRFGRPLSVLMIDVDHFKVVNDTSGHAAGDTVLRDLGYRLRSLVRDVDLVARYGGEEFVVLLPETGRAGAAEVAQRVVEAVRREPFGSDALSQPLRVTVSVGAATLPADGQDGADLVQAADRALYAAKEDGRDRWAAASGASAGAAPPG